MILGSESCIKATVVGLVFFTAFSLPACSDDEPVGASAPEDTSDEVSLPVRQWYPQPKNSRYKSANTPHYVQPQMMQSPAFQGSQPVGQPVWNGNYQPYQPAPATLPAQPQPYGSGSAWQAPAQQPGGTPYNYQGTPQQGASPYYNQAPWGQQGVTPQQNMAPYYSWQTPQRPWGEVPAKTPESPWSINAAPSRQVAPLPSWQSPGNPGYPGWGTPYGGYPGTVFPGQYW